MMIVDFGFLNGREIYLRRFRLLTGVGIGDEVSDLVQTSGGWRNQRIGQVEIRAGRGYFLNPLVFNEIGAKGTLD
jgi:hypothetical protein